MGNETKDSLNWGMLCHLAGLATYIGIPLGNVIAPLLIWLLKRKSNAFVETEGREAVNFNLSFTLYGLLAGVLCYVAIGVVLLPLVLITHLVLIIRAILQANKGEHVHYPFTLRFIK